MLLVVSGTQPDAIQHGVMFRKKKNVNATRNFSLSKQVKVKLH